MLWTYEDTVEHLLDFTATTSTDKARRFAMRAASDGLRDLVTAHRWSYYRAAGRVNTVEAYSTGTVAFDYSGGAHERLLTLSSGTWPTWARYGTVIIDSIPYEVAERVSDSLLTLTIASNPGADVASGTSYQLYRDTYPAPIDFQSCSLLMSNSRRQELEYVTPDDWLALQQSLGTVGTPDAYTIVGDPNLQGRMSFRFAAAPSSIEAFDFTYHRKHRALNVEKVYAGTVSIANGSASVTGIGTAFTSAHVGCVFRVYDSTNYPTGSEGNYPALLEQIITAVDASSGAGALTLDDEATAQFTGVKYTISDPVDIDAATMLNVFKRACEKNAAIIHNRSNAEAIKNTYLNELRWAIGADHRYTGKSVAVGPGTGASNIPGDYPARIVNS